MFASRAVQKPTQDWTPSRAKQTSPDQTQGLRQPENVLESSPPLHRYLGNSYVQAMTATGGETLQAPAVPPSVRTVPSHPSQSGILQRKCACDDAAGMSGECEECSKKQRLGLQTKLKVNEPGDVYEREADRVADQVMAAPAHPAVSGAPPRIQRFSGQSSGQTDAAPTSVGQALASPGRPLEPMLRQDMEQRFGYDFSRVRVHSEAAAAQSAQDVNATAYTVGHNMVFGAGRFAPGTHEGAWLIAHELTHVIQQQATMPVETRGSDVSASRNMQQYTVSAMALQRQVKDPRKLQVISIDTPRHIRVSEWLVESTPGGGTGRTQLYWVDFEVDAKGVVRASVRTVSPDRTYRSGVLQFGNEFRRALDHFGKSGVTVTAFEGDWSYMSKDEISENLKVFRESLAQGSTREKAAQNTPTGKVLAASGFEVTHVENVAESQPHLAEEGVRRWRVKATFRRQPSPPPTGPVAGGGAPPSSPSASQEATRGVGPTTTPSAAAPPTVGSLGKKPPLVSSRALAGELVATERVMKRMALFMSAARGVLRVWNAWNALLDYAKSVEMSVALLARRSPFDKEIETARNFERNAREFAEYFGSLDLQHHMASLERADPGWYDLYQIQLSYLDIEFNLHGPLESVEAIIPNIEEQIRTLSEQMPEKIAAIVMNPYTSLAYAEAFFFAEAGAKMRESLLAARDFYLSARNSIKFSRGVARAAAQRLELKLRELGSSGVFGAMSLDEVQSSDLEKFTFRSR